MHSFVTPPFVREQQNDPLLTAREVARILRVNPKTVTRWACAGRLPSVRTQGGHHRFRKSVIDALLGVANDEL